MTSPDDIVAQVAVASRARDNAVNCSSSSSGGGTPLSTTAVTAFSPSSRLFDRLLSAIAELEQLGLKRVEECVLLGAIAMIERCVAEHRSRGDVGLGWLAAAIRDGGAWFSEKSARPARPATVADMLGGRP